jgi:biopolymer transport protein ExbD
VKTRLCVLVPLVMALSGVARAAAPPSVEDLKVLVSRAASMSVREFLLLAESAECPPLHQWPNQTLTAMLATSPAADLLFGLYLQEDVRLLAKDDVVPPHDLAAAIAPPKGQPAGPDAYVSFIRPEYITACTRTVKGDTIAGTVTFRAKDIYEGQVEYTAGLGPEGWRIEEFRLPKSGAHTALTVRGVWIASPGPAWLKAAVEKMMEIKLPEAKPGPLPKPKELFINISAEGRLIMDGRVYSEADLATALKRAAEANPDTTVIIRADGRTRHENVVRVIDLCKQAGVKYYYLATVAPPGDPEPPK